MSSPPTQTHERYERIFAELEAPFAFVDLDAMWSNADQLLERAGAQADPGGDEVGPLPGADRGDPRPRRPLRRADDLHAAGDPVARRARPRGSAARLPDRRLERPARAGAALGRRPGAGADRDGRLRRAPRRDRGGARRRRPADPRLHRHRRQLVGARRPGQDRAEALADPHGRAGGRAGARDRTPAADRTRRADGLRGPDRRRRRHPAGQAAARGDDPLHAEALGGRAGRPARARSSPRSASSASWRSSTAAAPAASRRPGPRRR